MTNGDLFDTVTVTVTLTKDVYAPIDDGKESSWSIYIFAKIFYQLEVQSCTARSSGDVLLTKRVLLKSTQNISLLSS
jgi:hypothetical protein